MFIDLILLHHRHKALFFYMKNLVPVNWLRNRGYLHLSNQLNISRENAKLKALIENPGFVAKYAFHPLIHSIIKERRFKRVEPESKIRAHSYKINGKVKKQQKNRPLHYATHLDSMIFGFYAEQLQSRYEATLAQEVNLCNCITAYRRIKVPGFDANKSTIHFAFDVFEEIKNRKDSGCSVLKVDIKNFFSNIDHNILKGAWAKLLNQPELPNDHYNVFKAATRFSYIYLDDLRVKKIQNGVRSGFDEKRIAEIRKSGVQAFFKSSADFREMLKKGKFKLCRFPFRNERKEPVGIPQGLPISAVLANLYLLDFDKEIYQEVVLKFRAYYRRYSDDIIIVCDSKDQAEIEKCINLTISKSLLSVSAEKMERFYFKNIHVGKKGLRYTSIKQSNDFWHIGHPFTYLGFEFYGEKVLIKSANLAKFYRRMIGSVRRKVKRAISVARQVPGLQSWFIKDSSINFIHFSH